MFATDSGLKASANDAAVEDDAARLYVDSDADVNKKRLSLVFNLDRTFKTFIDYA